ncbi:sulfonate ABC transporter substrate-binding protein [Paenibacillus eucommiae]|uniref:Sulfonate transport system substrate-binding protein n=1 Tax=Paenibacillus eucommiae TaxID=1355755 RepID=A0ABS4IYN3_9BACL|nr:sulfonate ABC transporter substrate-binding protein [Paenibacillus eucommiae]MBP1992170.1 sulfonate transport system substrate-binding protein [Paenibacillus eucommiae]
MSRRNEAFKKKGFLHGALLVLLAVAMLTLSACSSSDSKPANTATADTKGKKDQGVVRIGYQKYASVNIMKEHGGLEERLEKIGYRVEWTEFPGGPQLLEAMNVGSIDVGHTGEAPPIFAQAAGTPLVYLGHSPQSPKAESLLVPENSSIQKIADLKGKKIALNKGSNVHYLLVKLLEKEGVAYEDVKVTFLPPADARAAFESGNVDGWVIWEPFYSAAQTATKARVLADGEGLVKNYEFYLASRTFAEKHADAIDGILDQLGETDKWAKDNLPEVAKLLSPALGIDVPSLEKALSHRGFGIERISDATIAEQQKIADAFLKLGLIPNAIQVSDAVIKK